MDLVYQRGSKRKMCKANVSRKDGSTGGLVYHLRRHHNFVSKYNAFKDFQELSEIKDKRMQARKRKNETSNDERPSKQQKITNCISTKYPSNHPQQVKITNSIGSMICHDAAPTNIVKRPGMVQTIDSKYTLPHPSTFSHSVIPKLKFYLYQ